MNAGHDGKRPREYETAAARHAIKGRLAAEGSAHDAIRDRKLLARHGAPSHPETMVAILSRSRKHHAPDQPDRSAEARHDLAVPHDGLAPADHAAARLPNGEMGSDYAGPASRKAADSSEAAGHTSGVEISRSNSSKTGDGAQTSQGGSQTAREAQDEDEEALARPVDGAGKKGSPQGEEEPHSGHKHSGRKEGRGCRSLHEEAGLCSILV